MTGSPIADPGTIRSLLDAHPLWYHRVEFAAGIVPAGTHPSARVLRELDAGGVT